MYTMYRQTCEIVVNQCIAEVDSYCSNTNLDRSRIENRDDGLNMKMIVRDGSVEESERCATPEMGTESSLQFQYLR